MLSGEQGGWAACVNDLLKPSNGCAEVGFFEQSGQHTTADQPRAAARATRPNEHQSPQPAVTQKHGAIAQAARRCPPLPLAY
jgi:hypothetical protein